MTTQSTPDALREAIARVIDPEAWINPSWINSAALPGRKNRSLAKADAIIALSAPPVSREVQQDQGVTAVPAAALAGQEPLSPTVSALRAPPANARMTVKAIPWLTPDARGALLNTGALLVATGALIYLGFEWLAFAILVFESLAWCFLAGNYRHLAHEYRALLTTEAAHASVIEAATADETENTGSARKGESAVPDRADAHQPQTAAQG